MLNGFDSAFLFLTAGAAVLGVRRKMRQISLGARENRSDNLGDRANGLAKAVFLHSRVLKRRPEGLFHLFLFWAFFLPLLMIFLVQLPFSLPKPVARLIALTLDIVGFLGVFGTVGLIVRRYVNRPERLDNKAEDAWGLFLFLAIFLTGFCVSGLRISIMGGQWFWSPASYFASGFFSFLPQDAASLAIKITWRIHMFLVLCAVAAISFGKLSHVFLIPANILFRNMGPKGAFSSLDIENSEVFGVGKIEDFTWKQLLDLEACVRCGRCQAVCPACATEKSLNPKKVIQDLKAHWLKKAPALLKGDAEAFEEPMLDGVGVSQEDVWACTTCRHCMEACPAMVEHVDKIIDMRRNLVLMEGQMPQELVNLNKNLEKNFNPWGVGWSDRNNWLERRGVEAKILTPSDKGKFDVLFWVGCAGAYDDRYQKVVASIVKVLNAAGVSFGILGTAEKCCGEPARVVGNEYLYQTLVAENIAAMDALGVKKILTACPHCLKTLAKEYPQFEGNYEVIHHSEFLLGLLEKGALTPKAKVSSKATFHDSCYLARYAGIISEPRRLMAAVESLETVEMPRHGEEGFCCGAGGGHMWMEETGKRINEERAGEALNLNAGILATACPFCLTMMSDGVKTHGKEEECKVLDIAEILEKSLG